MTKEQYLETIKQPSVPMNIWFEYYRECGGSIVDPERFEYVFSIILWNESQMVGSDGKMKQVTLNSALRRFHEYYAKKFNLHVET